MERYDPDLWTDEFAFLNQPGQADIQSDLFYDYRTNVDAYPKWQAWMREKQPRLLVIWGKYDLSFELSEPEAYRRDVPKAEVHVLDAGHFALDTAADEIAQSRAGLHEVEAVGGTAVVYFGTVIICIGGRRECLKKSTLIADVLLALQP